MKAKTVKYHTKESTTIAAEPTLEYGIAAIISDASLDLIATARKGVSMNFLTTIAEKLSLSLQEVGHILHVSLRTLQRNAPAKKLDIDASAKALQLATLYQKGVYVFGEEQIFTDWLREEVPALDYKKPINLLDTPFGFQLVMQVLGRIEHGVF